MCAGHLNCADAKLTIDVIDKIPPAPIWLFTLAAACGAGALAVLFGIDHLDALAMVIVSAVIGALVRRAIAVYSENLYLQPFLAALLAGFIGAAATRYQLSSSLRLVAVCPCMILVPGPHILNGMTDLLRGRISLGAVRLLFATLLILAISTGLLLGLFPLGISLPVEPEGRAVFLWTDILAAGLAAAAYSIYFNTPLKMLGWPIAVGMFAHALRWLVLANLDANLAIGAFIACVAVSVILTPVAHHRHLPFAAIGFASVVSMMPGIFLFRMISGLLQLSANGFNSFQLVSETLTDAFTAATIIFAMGIGLILPNLIMHRILVR